MDYKVHVYTGQLNAFHALTIATILLYSLFLCPSTHTIRLCNTRTMVLYTGMTRWKGQCRTSQNTINFPNYWSLWAPVWFLVVSVSSFHPIKCYYYYLQEAICSIRPKSCLPSHGQLLHCIVAMKDKTFLQFSFVIPCLL